MLTKNKIKVMENNYQNQETDEQKTDRLHRRRVVALYGYSVGFGAIKTFLLVTTAIAGASVGAHVADDFDLWIRAAAAVGMAVALVLTFDVALSYVFKQLEVEQFSDKLLIWIMAVVLTICTGSTTWVSATIIGELSTKKMFVTGEEKTDRVQAAVEMNDDRLKKIRDEIKEIRPRIDTARARQKRESEAVLIGVHAEHAAAARSGSWKNRNKRVYRTMVAVGESYQSIIDRYQSDIDRLTNQLSELESAETGALTYDPAKDEKDDIDDENDRAGQTLQAITGLIRFVDIAAAIILWILFLQIRSMKLSGVNLDIEPPDPLKWIVDRWSILIEKMLSSTEGVDDQIAIAFGNIIHFLASPIWLVGWIFGQLKQLIIIPTQFDIVGGLIWFVRVKLLGYPDNESDDVETVENDVETVEYRTPGFDVEKQKLRRELDELRAQLKASENAGSTGGNPTEYPTEKEFKTPPTGNSQKPDNQSRRPSSNKRRTVEKMIKIGKEKRTRSGWRNRKSYLIAKGDEISTAERNELKRIIDALGN